MPACLGQQCLNWNEIERVQVREFSIALRARHETRIHELPFIDRSIATEVRNLWVDKKPLYSRPKEPQQTDGSVTQEPAQSAAP